MIRVHSVRCEHRRHPLTLIRVCTAVPAPLTAAPSLCSTQLTVWPTAPLPRPSQLAPFAPRSLHALLLHLVFTCSAQHAAVSLPPSVIQPLQGRMT